MSERLPLAFGHSDDTALDRQNALGEARFVGNVTGRVHGGLLLDSSNNAEVIEVENAARGDWIVQVVASNVPHGPQDFALAAVLV